MDRSCWFVQIQIEYVATIVFMKNQQNLSNVMSVICASYKQYVEQFVIEVPCDLSSCWEFTDADAAV